MKAGELISRFFSVHKKDIYFFPKSNLQFGYLD